MSKRAWPKLKVPFVVSRSCCRCARPTRGIFRRFSSELCASACGSRDHAVCDDCQRALGGPREPRRLVLLVAPELAREVLGRGRRVLVPLASTAELNALLRRRRKRAHG